MATIYDIAKKVGVSPTTVSKVFNNYSDVSAKTKEKILKAADELGYIPNLTARSLKTNKSYLIGIIFSENLGIGLEHQFFSVVLESFRKAIGHYGYDTVFINNTLGDKKIGYLEHAKYRNVDGLFIITANPDNLDFEKLIESDMKCITTDILFEDVPYVMCDNKKGARMAVEYLHNHGHRKIAHLAGPFNTISAVERQIGYEEAIEALGLEMRSDYSYQAEMFKYQEAYDATIKMFENFNGDYPTALFVSADIMAIAAIKALEVFNLKVPDDISIVGFDDVAVAKYSNPTLTTVKQDKKLIGKVIAEMLYKSINNELVESRAILPVEIIERDSVKRID